MNRQTGEVYIGQASSPEHFVERQRDHNARLGVVHDYKVIQRAAPGRDLDVAEESQIRLHGGLRSRRADCRGVVNARYQMRDAQYQSSGGRVPAPIGSRIIRKNYRGKW